MSTFVDTIEFMVRHLEPGNLRSAVKCVLIQLYVPTESRGYRCLVVTIPMYNKDPAQSLTKEIYPAVARSMGDVGWKKVEKNIRDAISIAWKLHDTDVWLGVFRKNRKPKNGEFISRISEILDVWQSCIR